MVNDFACVLSGGGAKGAYQVGVFKAMREYPINVTSLSGSSIGGINALAFSLLSQEEIEELWKGFGITDFVSPDDDWSDGISDRDSLIEILEKIVPEYDMVGAIPVYNTICVDENTPEYVKLNFKKKEDIIKIVLATSALPVVYSKVEINGVLYQDGGIADNLPVKPLYEEEGTRDLIVVGLSSRLRIDKEKYPTDNLIEIFPSKDLGDLLDGTLNFSKKFIAFAMKLGYADAKRAINNYYGIDNGCHTEDYDYEAIMQELRVEALESDINRNMENLKKYFD